jgi:hypothetical protein
MNLTPRENWTVEGRYQLNKIATWGVTSHSQQRSTATAGYNDSHIHKSFEYILLLAIKRPNISEDHCPSSCDPNTKLTATHYDWLAGFRGIQRNKNFFDINFAIIGTYVLLL